MSFKLRKGDEVIETPSPDRRDFLLSRGYTLEHDVIELPPVSVFDAIEEAEADYEEQEARKGRLR